MKFETKFNVGESVWFIKDNVPTQAIISAIKVFHVGTNQDGIEYNAKKISNSVSWLDYQHLHEPMLFAKKGELLKSLFGEGKVCKGKNCTAIDSIGHSSECIAEHDEACGETSRTALPSPSGQDESAIKELISGVRSINRSKPHIVKIDSDDQPCYWQRKEWIEWILELADSAQSELTTLRAQLAEQPSASVEAGRTLISVKGTDLSTLGVDWWHEDGSSTPAEWLILDAAPVVERDQGEHF